MKLSVALAAAFLIAGCSGTPDRGTPSAAETQSRVLGLSGEPDAEGVRTLDGGLKVETLVRGEGPGILPGQTAVVHYTGRLSTGRVFDSSRDREPFEFILGRSLVIEGWHRGVRGMRKGEKRRLTIPPELGYGDRGVPGAIPPRATLIFDVELLEIKP